MTQKHSEIELSSKNPSFATQNTKIIKSKIFKTATNNNIIRIKKSKESSMKFIPDKKPLIDTKMVNFPSKIYFLGRKYKDQE